MAEHEAELDRVPQAYGRDRMGTEDRSAFREWDGYMQNPLSQL